MNCFICTSCGTQFANSSTPPAHCPICDDDRQFNAGHMQEWTTHDALSRSHRLRIEDDDGVLGFGITPNFAIPQRALLLPTDGGNILWECVSLVTDEVVSALNARGGVDLITVSHPHFYSSMVEWSEALGGVPILLHEADREWMQRPSARISFWSGDTQELSAGVTLLRAGGHFPGSTVLHWKDGPRAGGALFAGDAPFIPADRRRFTFLYSAPNYVPMPSREIRRMRELLNGYDFADAYGFTWGRNLIGNARAILDASFDRHLANAA
ncbi:MAG: MBL fold metallo-hydrolase [Devosia sp. 67-54]|uniref:MBL fold metallo-hydrolase n=1 Tax=Devosia sp. 67-54 TaxID=1895754 RepID=UPI000960CA90|nr:MBL fold metallo-hydrolase [Devosia sp. 67-54]OJX16707.1 MAG: MBL fold metallo-hydrolase [Devosia sp. 67-54]